MLSHTERYPAQLNT